MTNDQNIRSLTKTAGIIGNKAFQRLAEKTQVVHPKNGRIETVQNRLTHSYEVSVASSIITSAIAIPGIEIDYQKSVQNVSLTHDIGHPPFGHEGVKLIDPFFRNKGLREGFSDNNNNFIVIKKNQIDLDPYDIASLIKYPEKLYSYQKDELKRILHNAIDQDIQNFESSIKIYKRPTRTICCEIMDEADRNCYVTSDLADFYSLKLGDESGLQEILDKNIFDSLWIKQFLITAVSAIKEHNKSLIKKVFSDLKVELCKNYYLGDNLLLNPIQEELIQLRELLYDIEKTFFIKSKEVVDSRKIHLSYLSKYINTVFNEEYYPSKYYNKKIQQAKTDEEKLRLIRDMIGETTDWYIINFGEKGE